jgi:hypothetical protein
MSINTLFKFYNIVPNVIEKIIIFLLHFYNYYVNMLQYLI